MQTLLPHLGARIGRADLSIEHGEMLNTPGRLPAHLTWWPFQDVERHALFTMLLEDVD